jgi:formyltetrahydrofolate-dependent phosphoribosylglycinamide formyltransferase
MPRKINIGVLGSTRGTDLQAVIDAIKAGELPNIDLQIVIANKSDAYILERAKSQGFSALFLDPKGKTREEYDAEILDVMKENQVELILCLGYMKIITKTLIDQYRDRIWNIHPSLLPKYAGGMDLNVHEEVLKNHETESGCTLHVITEQVDAGKIIKQKKVLITAEETTETLKKKVQKLEQAAIIEALKEYSNA